MEWKPIETAPKDGTEILVWDKWDRTAAYWSEVDKIWRVAGALEDDLATPTHWMPLPDPPTAKINESDLPSIEEVSGSIHPDCEIFETRTERENA